MIGEDGKVELRRITLGRNLGNQAKVLSQPSDRIVNHPPDSLTAGDAVRIVWQDEKRGKYGTNVGCGDNWIMIPTQCP
ncbi:MAG TPA: hypothetical protein VEK34_16700 [Methylocella sp.]|nr:hypothetical protein [Methylocella sp.]